MILVLHVFLRIFPNIGKGCHHFWQPGSILIPMVKSNHNVEHSARNDFTVHHRRFEAWTAEDHCGNISRETAQWTVNIFNTKSSHVCQ